MDTVTPFKEAVLRLLNHIDVSESSIRDSTVFKEVDAMLPTIAGAQHSNSGDGIIADLKATIKTYGELNNRLAEELRTANEHSNSGVLRKTIEIIDTAARLAKQSGEPLDIGLILLNTKLALEYPTV